MCKVGDIQSKVAAELVDSEQGLLPSDRRMHESQTDQTNGRKKLVIAIDGAWSNHTNSQFNSKSGHHLTVGCMTGRVIAFIYYSHQCTKCDYLCPHDPSFCAQNYQGSSRGMEAMGAGESANGIWDSSNAYIAVIVMDNDASTRLVLCESIQEKIAVSLAT